MKLKIYEVNSNYINYLSPYAPHLFHNRKPNQYNERKFIGVVFKIRDFKYFAPLSSFKFKHQRMKENLDFLKLDHYAVINLNNMFPVPEHEYKYVNIHSIESEKYRYLLLAEYRLIRNMQDTILRNAENLYNYKLQYNNSTPLGRRCNDFLLLEEKCMEYVRK